MRLKKQTKAARQNSTCKGQLKMSEKPLFDNNSIETEALNNNLRIMGKNMSMAFSQLFPGTLYDPESNYRGFDSKETLENFKSIFNESRFSELLGELSDMCQKQLYSKPQMAE